MDIQLESFDKIVYMDVLNLVNRLVCVCCMERLVDTIWTVQLRSAWIIKLLAQNHFTIW